MIIGVIVFIISWLIFYLFAYKRTFSLYALTGFIGIILAFASDFLILKYPLWGYPGTSSEKIAISIMNASGIYFIVIYLFLQKLPEKQTVVSVVRYILLWALFSIILELIFLYVGFIKHDVQWNTGFSFGMDTILFTIFYFHHKWVLKVINGNTIHNGLNGGSKIARKPSGNC